MNDAYVRTVQLLLNVAPAIFETPAFAMKGGTALNLFVQDMPRLSVDIDVVFVPHDLKREDALKAISEELFEGVTWRPVATAPRFPVVHGASGTGLVLAALPSHRKVTRVAVETAEPGTSEEECR